MADLFSLDLDGARATITLARPERHNVMRADDLGPFERMLGTVDKSEAVRVLVLTGAGERTFCSGFDITTIADVDWRERPLDGALDRLEDLRIPTICALNGSAYGGGADLALACDFRIGVRGMKVFVPPARLGVQYHAGGLRRFVERLGLGPAKRLLLAGETFDDGTLLDVGYLDALVDREALRPRVDALAGEIAGLAPLAISGMKGALNQIARGAADWPAIEASAEACLRSADAREGLSAFNDKRPPRFRGA